MLAKSSKEEAIYAMMHELVVCVEYVTDPRGRQGRRHLLSDILTIAVIGCICGCDDAENLEDWAIRDAEWLENFLELPAGIPSQDTFLRVLAAIDEREFRIAFGVWARKAFPQAFGAGQVAIDGKTARRSGTFLFVGCAKIFLTKMADEHDLYLSVF